jgi:hypothetical protein
MYYCYFDSLISLLPTSIYLFCTLAFKLQF